MSQLSQLELNTPYRVQYDPLKTQKMSHSLVRYSGFKPGSMSKKQDGILTMNEKDAIETNFEENYFTGTKAESKNVFVLIYDKNRQTFRLERIKSQMQLKKSLDKKQTEKKIEKSVQNTIKQEEILQTPQKKVDKTPIKEIPTSLVAPMPLISRVGAQFDSDDDSSDDSDDSESE